MKILGFQKTTLLDYPEKIAATIFLGGCNFLCPFCHNASLVNKISSPHIDIANIKTVLNKRKHILEGVCITGGEPTLHNDLPELISLVKEYGYLVKLDTNGSNPDLLHKLLEQKMLDYVAMDIKNCLPRYEETIGVSFDLKPIEASVQLLKECSIPYEFRTTVVKELHQEDDFLLIGKWLNGSSQYFLQNYMLGPNPVSNTLYTSYTKEELEYFVKLLAPYFKTVRLRGV